MPVVVETMRTISSRLTPVTAVMTMDLVPFVIVSVLPEVMLALNVMVFVAAVGVSVSVNDVAPFVIVTVCPAAVVG